MTVLGLLATSAYVGAAQATEPSRMDRSADGVVGASISHPEEWVLEREAHTFDKTYGFTLWRQGDAAADHGGTPAVRVALAYNLKPGQIDDRVRQTIGDYPDLTLKRQEVGVARGRAGVAVGPEPGSTPFTAVYVPVEGRVYKINVYSERPGEEGLDADDRALLSSLRFVKPARPVASLDLPAANSAEELYAPGDAPDPTDVARAAKEESFAEGRMQDATFGASSISGERRIAEGCYLADPDFFVQTQHGRYANSRSGDGIPRGYTIVGKPNYWGEYTHGSIDMGRCHEPDYTNDKFAVDYPLNRGDAIFTPFRCGRVTFAGRNESHGAYGIMVIIRACNGKYVSLAGHLDRLAAGIYRGAKIGSRNKVIGYAGNTGGCCIPVGRVHLHQAFYRYPSYKQDGSPYGGRGLKIVRHHYFRGKGGVYTFGCRSCSGGKSKGDRITN
jgi:Peptidase family M23